MKYRDLIVDRVEQIQTITLNRQHAENALDVALMDELRTCIDELGRNETVRAVIVTGAGRTFSVGADVRMLEMIGETYAPQQTRDQISDWRATFDAFEALPQVTIAAINGATLGGGIILALACDFRIASSRASFGLPEIKLGMAIALGGTQRLTRVVGTVAAKEMILRGRNVTAMEALRMGLVNRVCDHGDLLGLSRNWAERALGYPQRTLALAKRLIHQSPLWDTHESARAETDALVELIHSQGFLTQLRGLYAKGEA